jgi:hypothetical protein
MAPQCPKWHPGPGVFRLDPIWTAGLFENGDGTPPATAAAMSARPAADRDSATRPWRRDLGPATPGTARTRRSGRDRNDRHRGARRELVTVCLCRRCHGHGARARSGCDGVRSRCGCGRRYRGRRLALHANRSRGTRRPGPVVGPHYGELDVGRNFGTGSRTGREGQITVRNGSRGFLDSARTAASGQ